MNKALSPKAARLRTKLRLL